MSKKKRKADTISPVSAPQPGGERTAPAAAEKKSTPIRQERPRPVWMDCTVLVLMVSCFFLNCWIINETFCKKFSLFLLVVTILCCLIRFPVLRSRLSLPFLGVTLWILMNGISIFYANSGTYALREFLKLAVGYCGFLLILVWSRSGDGAGRSAAAILEGNAALASLVSIDMISTQWISSACFAVLDLLVDEFEGVAPYPIEAGVRIKSLYSNPNVFAGVAGLGVLLSLGLAVTARKPGEKRFHLACLFLCSLAFVLAFSMGASAAICVAFLLLLFLERKSRRASLLITMVETLFLSLLCAFPIFLTSFSEWTGFRPIPLLCAVVGSAALCLIDRTVGVRAAALLQEKGRLLLVTISAVLLLLAAYIALALNMTGPIRLSPEEVLTRADYPAPGSYTLEVQSSSPVTVTVHSQNQLGTMMHTYETLYTGAVQGAAFTVPEDSLVVYFQFSAQEDTTLSSVSYTGEAGSGSLKLNYKLLPGFMANRLQGLFANQNAIQRTVFFADGMKLFLRSPIIGLGLGAFENGILNVQDFYYQTKYAHNHYIETLASTGIVGLILFVGTLLLCAAAVWKNLRRGEDSHPLVPALGAALVYMAIHCGVEVVLSLSFYVPSAICLFALICLCCGEELPFLQEKEAVRCWVAACVLVPMGFFSCLLYLSLDMYASMEAGKFPDAFTAYEQGIRRDVFERNSYMLSYVVTAKEIAPMSEPVIYEKAGQYAKELESVDSNIIPEYLAIFYFTRGENENAIAMLEKYVDYCPSDSKIWNVIFEIMSDALGDTPEDQQTVSYFYQKMKDWDASHIGSLVLTDEMQAYVDSMTVS